MWLLAFYTSTHKHHHKCCGEKPFVGCNCEVIWSEGWEVKGQKSVVEEASVSSHQVRLESYHVRLCACACECVRVRGPAKQLRVLLKRHLTTHTHTFPWNPLTGRKSGEVSPLMRKARRPRKFVSHQQCGIRQCSPVFSHAATQQWLDCSLALRKWLLWFQ